MKVYSIGRNEDCTIVLDNPMVSRRHALLKVHASGKMELVSLGTNGTFVNGNKLKPNAPYTVKRSDVVSFAHAKQLDWDLVENPIWWLKYALYGLAAIIVLGLAYAMIDHWLIKKPKQPEPTEQLMPKSPKAQNKADKATRSVTDNNGKPQGSNNKMEGSKTDKAKSDEAEDKGGSFFPKQKKAVNGAQKVEKETSKGSKVSTNNDKQQQKQKQEKKSDKSSTDESGFNVI